MSSTKFIRDSSNNIAIFSAITCVGHNEAVKLLESELVSAGFCGFDKENNLTTYGKSVSTKKESTPIEDSKAFSKHLSNNNLYLIFIENVFQFKHTCFLTNINQVPECLTKYCAVPSVSKNYQSSYHINESNIEVVKEIISAYEYCDYMEAVNRFIEAH